MRKLILLTTFALTLFTSCSYTFAQRYRARDAEYFSKHEFYVQYGAPTIIELTSTLRSSTIRNANEIIPKNAVFSGVVGLGYNFSISKLLAVGVYAGASLASADLYSLENKSESLEYNSKTINYTGQISAHWTIYEEGAVQLSTGAYIGLNYRDDTVNLLTQNPSIPTPKVEPFEFAYHLTAIKVRYGNVVGLLAELGFGYRGLINVGMSVKL